MNDNELGLYIHIPFCKSKCYYCDFNSYDSKNSIIPIYCEALIREIEYYQRIVKPDNYQIKSIFIGGGTPSFIPQEYIYKILEKCRNAFKIQENAEITIEANPGTLSEEKLAVYKSAGINRLSIGLQAWQNNLLKSLGRIHTSDDFITNVIAARKLGISNISVDLIFGLPGQTLDEWLQTLDNVLNLGVNHLSCYSLKIEEGTMLEEKIKKGEMPLPDEDLDREMYHNTITKLNSKGFSHYEISNFSKLGFESRHNLIYWNVGLYIGLGAGAHSCFEGKRYNNEENPEDYVSQTFKGNIPKKDIVILNRQDNISEYLILGLRLIEGIKIEKFNQLFGKNLFELYQDKIDKLIERKLLNTENGYLKLTSLGLDLANQVFVEFI